MKKKTATTVLVVMIVMAIFIGLLLINKGDGPVMGMVLADRTIETTDDYETAVETQGDGVFLILSNAFNKYQEDYKTDIPSGHDLYATVYLVECPQGSEYTAKWLQDGVVMQEELGVLQTGPKGVISYKLPSDNVIVGSYQFELYDGDEKIFEMSFSVE